jgi:hypothetical protein
MSTDSQAHDNVHDLPASGTRPATATDTHQHLAMLRILYGACVTALEAFRAADNPVDDQLVADLETTVERTKSEIERLTTHLAQNRP